jgi:peptidoglycan/xylan/chitin deacetylase (PgdA/CDA1 family)
VHEHPGGEKGMTDSTVSAMVVMYHYVWPDGAPVPEGIRPLKAGEFLAQLDWLEDRYDILNARDFLDSLKSPRPGKPACLLTFDDGTRDHAEVVTPILAERGLSGVFFVLTWPMELKRMPLTHCVHWLLGQGDELVWREFERGAGKETGSLEVLGRAEDAMRIYHYETPLRARIKYAANMALPHTLAERIVARAIRATGQSLEELAEQWFVTSRQIVQMRDAGMTIGLHGCSHRSLQVLGPAGIREEIAHASNYIASVLEERATWFACPFGGSGAGSESLAAMHEAMRNYCIVGSVTTEKALAPNGCDPWRLPRLDAIDLPPRKSWDAESFGARAQGGRS